MLQTVITGKQSNLRTTLSCKVQRRTLPPSVSSSSLPTDVQAHYCLLLVREIKIGYDLIILLRGNCQSSRVVVVKEM